MSTVLSQCEGVILSYQVTRRQLESVVGLLNFAGPMLQLGRLLLTPVIVWMNTFSLASRRDDPIQVDAHIHGCTQVARAGPFHSKALLPKAGGPLETISSSLLQYTYL